MLGWMWMALFGYNALVFLVYVLDKWKARRRGWRISEATLLWLALLGGALGALLAMRIARHKTQKPAFAWGVPLMLAGQAALCFYYFR
jgi:uncharacterized membrane protein YsdA (DUF1294 family)